MEDQGGRHTTTHLLWRDCWECLLLPGSHNHQECHLFGGQNHQEYNLFGGQNHQEYICKLAMLAQRVHTHSTMDACSFMSGDYCRNHWRRGVALLHSRMLILNKPLQLIMKRSLICTVLRHLVKDSRT